MSISMWSLWAIVLIAQNFAFTFVSRARNSGSLRRHIIASVGSNGIWFISQILIFSQLFKIMTGQYGVIAAVLTALYYTVFTITGSILAHHVSLKTEKGKSAVGANKKLAQFTSEEGELIRKHMVTAGPSDSDFAFTLTLDEIANLKELAGTKLETVDELVTESLPPSSLSSLVAQKPLPPSWQPQDITKIPPAMPGQGAKL